MLGSNQKQVKTDFYKGKKNEDEEEAIVRVIVFVKAGWILSFYRKTVSLMNFKGEQSMCIQCVYNDKLTTTHTQSKNTLARTKEEEEEYIYGCFHLTLSPSYHVIVQI